MTLLTGVIPQAYSLGIFNLISSSSMIDSKPDEAKSMSLGDLKKV